MAKLKVADVITVTLKRPKNIKKDWVLVGTINALIAVKRLGVSLLSKIIVLMHVHS